MKTPTLKQIDEIRKDGYRANVVACFLHNKKTLLLFQGEYKLWGFPQGGINNKEKPQDAILRGAEKDLGKEFVKNIGKKFNYFYDDLIDFPEHKHGVKDLKTDDGEDVLMKGKKYLFFAIKMKSEDIDLKDTEFEQLAWVDYKSAKFLADRIYQINKARITAAALDKLKEEGYIE